MKTQREAVPLTFVGEVRMPGPGTGWLEERRRGLLTGGTPADPAVLFWMLTNSNSDDSLEPPFPCGGVTWVDMLVVVVLIFFSGKVKQE